MLEIPAVMTTEPGMKYDKMSNHVECMYIERLWGGEDVGWERETNSDDSWWKS